MSDIDLDKDIDIIEAATDGTWHKVEADSHHGNYVEIDDGATLCDLYFLGTGEFNPKEVCSHGDDSGENAEYIAHFNPAYTRQLVEKLKFYDKPENWLGANWIAEHDQSIITKAKEEMREVCANAVTVVKNKYKMNSASEFCEGYRNGAIKATEVIRNLPIE